MAGARDRNISESQIEQIGMDARISVDEDPVCRETLRAVTGHCVSMIEVSMIRSVKLNVTPIIEACGNVSIWFDRVDHGKVAVGNAERLVGCRELNSVADREFMRHLR